MGGSEILPGACSSQTAFAVCVGEVIESSHRGLINFAISFFLDD